MSQKAVRQAVQSFLVGQSIAHLNKIYRAEPVLLPGDAFFATAGDEFGAVAYPFVYHSIEQYEALQRRRINYTVDLVVMFRAIVPDLQSGDVDPGEAAMEAFDDILDATKAALRSISGRTLGGAVFSAGEGAEQQQPDLEVIPWGLPYRDEDTDQIRAEISLRFRVVESIAAPTS